MPEVTPLADPTTPSKGYTLPTVGGDVNTWGPILNTNFTLLDSNLAGVASIALAGAAGSVSGSNLQQAAWKFTGNLASQCVVTWTPAFWGMGVIINLTTGGQNLVCGVSGGASVTITPNETVPIFADGLNFYRMAIGGGGAATTGTGAFVLANNPTINGATSLIPPGIIAPYAGSTAPAGGQWLLCNGAAVSRTTYAALFAVCGTSYGAGDGTSTFNVPDSRGRVFIGYDPTNATGRMTGVFTGGLNANTLGNVGGEQGHVLITSELAVHNHGMSDPGHTHGLSDPGHAHSLADPGHGHGVNDPSHAHGISDPGHSHSYYAMNWSSIGYSDWAPNSAAGNVISAATLGTGGSGTSIGIYGANTGISIAGAGCGIGVYGSGTGMGVNTGYTNIGTTNTGGNASHNNVPPGQITNYIIKI